MLFGKENAIDEKIIDYLKVFTFLSKEEIEELEVKNVYDSETASELYAAFDKMKAKFPDFIKSVTDCSNYLSNTVAPAYEKVETTASSKIG